jgi:serine protease Do
VEAGDIILKVDGKTVERSADLPRLIGATKPGAKSQLQLFRRGQMKEVAVTVAEFEPDRPRRTAQAAPEAPSAPAAKTAIGLAVTDLTEAQKKELKLRGGVRVESVEGAAARAGVREDDVIVTIDNVEVVDAKQFNAQVGKLDKNKPVSVMVRRGELTNYLVIRPAPR